MTTPGKWRLFYRYCEGPITGQWFEWVTFSRRKDGRYRLRAGTSSPHELRVSIPNIRTGVDLADALERYFEDCQFDDTVISAADPPDLDDLLESIEKIDPAIVRAARLHLYDDENYEPDPEQRRKAKADLKALGLDGVTITWIGRPGMVWQPADEE
jgi:hypothetical protein